MQQGRLFTWLSFGSALPAKVAQFSVGANSHHHLSQFTPDDLTTWKREMADLSGVAYGGVA
jgi:hypothetical protein